jgi:hypothetical protein
MNGFPGDPPGGNLFGEGGSYGRSTTSPSYAADDSVAVDYAAALAAAAGGLISRTSPYSVVEDFCRL